MNYTGGPSISGCRPVLSLYPTHRFCQYLLLIFITFTNSFLFNRAFSTNSRRALSHAAGVTLPGLNLSVTADAVPPPLPRGGFGIAENFSSSPEAPLLGELASEARLRGCTKESLTISRCWAQPLRHCFAMPPPLPRGGLGRPRKVNGFARGSPTRGAVERSETERLYEGRPDREPLLGSTSPSLLRNATSPTEGRLWQSSQSERFRQRLPY